MKLSKERKEKIITKKIIARIYSERPSVKNVSNLLAVLSNLLAMEEISAIEVAFCSVEALIPAVEEAIVLITVIFSLISLFDW